MLNPWSYQKKNHTKILQQHIAKKQSLNPDAITLDEMIEYLNNVNGTIFGEETFAPVYEFGKSIKEIDLVWAPTIERKSLLITFEILKQNKKKKRKLIANAVYNDYSCYSILHNTLARQQTHFTWKFIVYLFIFTDESCESAILTRPIKDYLDDSSDIDVMFGYTSAVNEPYFFLFLYSLLNPIL